MIKNIIKLLIVSILITVNVYAKPKPKYDVRKVRWGYSKKQVLKVEGRPVKNTEDNMLPYMVKLAGYKVFLIYIFHENKLYRVMYSIRVRHLMNANEYIKDFDYFLQNYLFFLGFFCRPIKTQSSKIQQKISYGRKIKSLYNKNGLRLA